MKDLLDRIVRERDMSDDVLIALAHMVAQHCVPYYKTDDPDEVCANGNTPSTNAIYVLSELGLLGDVGGAGRCVHASWTDLGKKALGTWL